MPALFGSERNLQLLLDIVRLGPIPMARKTYNNLEKAGIVTMVVDDQGRHFRILDTRHPLAEDIRELAVQIAGGSLDGKPAEMMRPYPDKPSGTLGHFPMEYLVLHAFAHAEGPLSIEMIVRSLSREWHAGIPFTVKKLVAVGMLVDERGGLVIAPAVPQAYVQLIRANSALRAQTDPLFAPPTFAKRVRTNSFIQAADGAPRLFGTDVRLRNLMALAVHGPLWHGELRRLIGTTHLRLEDDSDAPFGRGDVVRTWGVGKDRALALDEAHPLHPPLRRLLVKLAEIYPGEPLIRERQTPQIPKQHHEWNGDRLALFGSPIPTLVLLSLADRHWTFEAHICAVAADWYRENVKKSIKRLEDEGVLEGSRPRGPGFGPRLLRLAAGFHARDELEAVIDAAAVAWPDLGARIQAAFDEMPAKTKAYFRKHGLL